MILHIEGMACPRCAARVEKALAALDGTTAAVDLQAKTATVTTALSAAILCQAVEALGFSVRAVEE